LINEIERQVRSTDHMVDMVLSMLRGVVANLPLDPRRALLVRVMNSPGFERGFKGALVPNLEKSNAFSDLYTYSVLSDAELEQYIQFLSSPHGQTFTRAVWSGLDASIRSGSVELGTRIAALVEARPQN
jgi:hypothetical protein